MKTTKMLAILVLVLGLMAWPAKLAGEMPMGTAFTYQGRLVDADTVADGLYDFQFKLFDDPNLIFGKKIGITIDANELDVIDGYFTLPLDFGGDVFTGDPRWLEIGVRPGELSGPGAPNEPNAYTVLQPRQEVAPSPYAIYAEAAGTPQSLDAADGSPKDAVYVDNEGNVGIGTTSPSARLQIDYGSGSENIKLGGSEITDNHDGVLRMRSGGSVVAFDGGDKVGIGTQSPEGLFHVMTGFNTDFKVLNDGRVYVGNNLTVYGVLRVTGWNAGSGTDLIVNPNGFIQKKSSSRRYKKNIRSLDLDRTKIFNLHPVKFEWKTTGQEDIGLIAEEVEEVLKELVIYDLEGKPEAVKYDRVALYLLGVVKAQQEKIAALEQAAAQTESLRRRLEALEKMVGRQEVAFAKEVQQ
jgi:hypothetical protein